MKLATQEEVVAGIKIIATEHALRFGEWLKANSHCMLIMSIPECYEKYLESPIIHDRNN
jgi:hypothetical protein